MKKKLLWGLLALLSVVCLALGLAACNVPDGGDGGGSDGDESAHTHEYGSLIDEKPATCTQKGLKAHYRCEGCGKYFDEDKTEKTLSELEIAINSAAHTYGSLIGEKPATCTDTGVKAHYHCACGKYFNDKKEEISEQNLTIPADSQAHSFTQTVINPWRDYKVCAYCGETDDSSRRDHEFEEGSTKCKYCDYECDYLYYAANSDEHNLQIYGFRAGGEKANVVIPAEWYGYKVVEVSNFDSTDIESVTIPESVKIINKEAFEYCDKLTKVIIEGNGLTEIGYSAFWHCSALTELELPESTVKIGSDAFNGCTLLKSINLSPELSSLGTGAFKGCESLLRIDIPDNLTWLGTETFKDCKSLQIAEISENSKIDTFGRDLFRGCGALTEIKIPKGLTEIGAGAFAACTGLKKVILHGTVADWAQIYVNGYEANVYYNPLKYAHDLYEGGKLVTDLVIPGTVEWIESYAFYGCSAKSIKVEEGVTGIGDGAFMYMLDAASLTLPASLEEIGSYILNPFFDYPDNDFSGEPKYHKLYKGTVNYNGTTDQWKSIQKGDLGFGSGGSNLECNVQCKNGTVLSKNVNDTNAAQGILLKEAYDNYYRKRYDA